ncbi:MAG: phosphoribosyltransferase [Methanoregula sp.]|nr:phosphoribosyltransferase [Methanoregula sp.]
MIIQNKQRSVSPETRNTTINQTQNPTENGTVISTDNSKKPDLTSEVIFLFDYYPKKDYRTSGINPKHDIHSSRILNLKSIDEKNEAATTVNEKYVLSNMDIDRIKYYAGQIEPLIQKYKDLVICVMPKSKKSRESSGIRMVAKKLCQTHYIDGTDIIYRPVDREPRHVDGNRDYLQELASLQITDSNLIKGKTVLLLDDVKTQGNSLNAGKTLLLSQGAKQVIMFALGKTSQ